MHVIRPTSALKIETDPILHLTLYLLFSFPGGLVEDQDVDVIHTALRETEEELNISRARIDVWGEMLPVPGKVLESNSTISFNPPLSPLSSFTLPWITHFHNLHVIGNIGRAISF